MNRKCRGSYTVEGTIIVSLICVMIGLIVVLGFYGHDRAVIQTTANELSMMASLWSGRYVSPTIKEVDYEALKQGNKTDLSQVEDNGYQMLQSKLLYGEVQSVDIFRTAWKKSVCVAVVVRFQIWNYEFEYKTESLCRVFDSHDLPRKKIENREEE